MQRCPPTALGAILPLSAACTPTLRQKRQGLRPAANSWEPTRGMQYVVPLEFSAPTAGK